MATITLHELTKVYANGHTAVRGVDLDVGEGELMVLVGPSGCGKTSILRMVAGLEGVSGGTVEIGGRVMNDVSPKERDIAMVFQNYALYPHMTVAENIGFALRLRRMEKAELRSKVEAAAAVLDLSRELDKKPGQLSGGQRQRVAMGRAIVREPAVFLMDEPLSNLDAKLRTYMRAEVMRIQRQIGVATLYVTHDQIEAMTMGDRVAVMEGGQLQQCDAPQVLYDHPANLFVAAFIGSPAMNLYEGQLSDDGTSIQLGDQRLRNARARSDLSQLMPYAGRRVVVGLRPESLTLAAEGEDHESHLGAEVELVESLGPEQLVHFRMDASRVRVDAAEHLEDSSDADTGGVAAMARTEGVARVGSRVHLRAGDRIRLAVDATRLHLFDPDTGLSIQGVSDTERPLQAV